MSVQAPVGIKIISVESLDVTMTDSAHLRQLCLMSQYNTWSNTRLYELVASLSDEERQRDLGAFFQSIQGTLNHLLLTDRIWLGRFATTTPHTFPALQAAKLIFECASLKEVLYPNFAELRSERSHTDQVIEQWMQALEPALLSLPMRYYNSARTIEREHPLWFGLTHFFNHQTHHRSQATTLLSQLGYDYGITDVLAMYDRASDRL